MKRLIMCEGPNELAVMNILLENNALIFTEDDLLGLTAYHARQIRTNTQVKAALNMYPGNDVMVSGGRYHAKHLFWQHAKRRIQHGSIF